MITKKNPLVHIIADPKGLDLAIQNIQVALNQISWLEKSFGRAIEVDKKPLVFQEGKDYYPTMANDALKSFSFFRANRERSAENYEWNVTSYFEETIVDLIVWGNMKKIDTTKNYPFKEELLIDVLKVLKNDSNILIRRIWDERPEDVFSNYEIDDSKLMYPFFGFRIEMNLRYDVSLC